MPEFRRERLREWFLNKNGWRALKRGAGEREDAAAFAGIEVLLYIGAEFFVAEDGRVVEPRRRGGEGECGRIEIILVTAE